MDGNDNMAAQDKDADLFVLDTELMDEVLLCTATGAQARFMTVLQRMLSLFLGSNLVYESRKGGFIDDDEVKRKLVKFRNNSARASQSGDTLGKSPTENRDKQYTLLLGHLRTLEESFVAGETHGVNQEEKKRACATIRESLLDINDLFYEIAPVESSENTQEKQVSRRFVATHTVRQENQVPRSLVATHTIKLFRNELKNLEKVRGSSAYSAEQLMILRKLIPQFNVMMMTPDEQNRCPSFVYPGLREEYFLRFVRSVLASHYVVTEVIDRVVKLKEEKEQIKKELEETKKELAEETKEKEYWQELCRNAVALLEANLEGAAKGNPPSGSADGPQLPDNNIPEVVKEMQDTQLASTEDQADE